MHPAEHHYAILDNDTIINVVVCDDPDHADSQGWKPLPDIEPLPWIGWTYDGTTWTPPLDEP